MLLIHEMFSRAYNVLGSMLDIEDIEVWGKKKGQNSCGPCPQGVDNGGDE